MIRFFSLVAIIFIGNSVFAQDYDQDKMRYIEQFKYWAMDEQVRTGVPASVSLAQGILETGSGKSELCKEANNHFGIKCKKEWTGDTYLHDDDKRHECFRKYKSAKDSYVDHSNFLTTRAHYEFLFSLEPTDYKAWCNGLRKAGYATNPKYAVRLIDLIEKYNLQQYTYEALEIAEENNVTAEVIPSTDKTEEIKTVAAEPVTPRMTQQLEQPVRRKVIFDKLMTKNGRQGFWARKGDYLLPEAVQYNIRYAKLLTINDLDDAPLYDDMFIYLKRKAKKGDRSFYTVKPGETLHSISQNTGVQLKYLYIYNNLYDLEEPAVGEKVYLQTRSSATPRLRGATAVSKTSNTGVEQIAIDKKEAARAKQQAEITASEAKQRALEEELRKSEEIAKKLEAQKERAAIEVQKEKEAAALAKVKEEPKKDERVISRKPTVATSTSIVAKKGNSPILDFEKAKRVEKLMGDGSKEIHRLEFERLKSVKEEKVIPAPGSNEPNLVKEKAAKTKSKQLKNKRKYNEKNVDKDVKDLKKKFDSLIYED